MVIKSFILLLVLSTTSYASELALGTSTSTNSSGLLNVLIPAFEKDSGNKVKIFSVGTGTALRMARQGKVDVLLVHAPPAEIKFIEQGYGLLRTPVMHNDFVLIGPENDPAKIHGIKDATFALKQILQSQSLFISRADDSGTHKKEKIIWKNINVVPYGEWYFELGAGMGKTLQVANERNAYTIVDRGTWLAKRKSVKLVLHVESDPLLRNPYHVIATNPDKYKKVNFKAAKQFIKWVTSKRGQDIINNLRVDGDVLFTGNTN